MGGQSLGVVADEELEGLDRAGSNFQVTSLTTITKRDPTSPIRIPTRNREVKQSLHPRPRSMRPNAIAHTITRATTVPHGLNLGLGV